MAEGTFNPLGPSIIDVFLPNPQLLFQRQEMPGIGEIEGSINTANGQTSAAPSFALVSYATGESCLRVALEGCESSRFIEP